MSIEFVCPDCGKKLRAEREHAGLATQCPKCHATLTIPPPPLDPGSAAPPPPSVMPAVGVGPALETGNPYQSPLGSAALDALPADFQLASRGQRFLGAMLDNMLYLLVASMFTGVIVATAIFFGAQLTEDDSVVYGALAVGLLGMIGLQSLLIATRGQTMGKMLLKTKIVSLESGQIPGFLQGVVVRFWLPVILAGIPVVKMLCVFDVLAIAGSEQRCVHDYLAGTTVIRLPGSRDVLRLKSRGRPGF